MLKRLTLTHVGPAPKMNLEFGDRLNPVTPEPDPSDYDTLVHQPSRAWLTQ
ncbi:MAG: hypothetical protein HQL84_04545 [Magnetococcales bacterium]|nr:hypothetical protein [Magnetococcales bacterium]MBF0149297.1 hypothetical protein [Magnetococcales bacterium]MBF0630675.1 hypothetical protein [Magnetococcales bacterium]